MNRTRRIAVVVTRHPRYGSGKRRLAREVGEARAWRFQRWALASLVRRLGRDRRWTLVLALTPDRAAAWAVPGLRRTLRRPQGSGDLGARMQRLLQGPGARHVVLIGSDCPAVAPADVAAAFDALRRAPWVLGPATDGGYWLIGARRRPTLGAPFRGVRWSSRHTLADTLANLPAETIVLRLLSDVDEAGDLEPWRGLF